MKWLDVQRTEEQNHGDHDLLCSSHLQTPDNWNRDDQDEEIADNVCRRIADVPVVEGESVVAG